MDKDNLVISRIEDRINQSRDGYYVTQTGFLNSHEQALARGVIRNSGALQDTTCLFYGGYEDAERRMLLCSPREYGITAEEVENSGILGPDGMAGMLRVLRIDTLGNARTLTHRDYLGSVLGLGLDRSVIGDILVRQNGADIIIAPEIADFLMSEYSKVGRVEIRTSVETLDQLTLPEYRTETIRDTVPSLRLDNIISSAFRVSRTSAVEAIRRGIVSVDHIEMEKPDTRVDEGSVLVLRGRGKAILEEIGGESRKGRIWVVIRKYI